MGFVSRLNKIKHKTRIFVISAKIISSVNYSFTFGNYLERERGDAINILLLNSNILIIIITNYLIYN
jgi:hypothetical protein